MRKVAQYINRRSFIGTTGTLTAGWVIVPGTFIRSFENTSDDQRYIDKSEMSCYKN